jgi:hypothetical protein
VIPQAHNQRPALTGGHNNKPWKASDKQRELVLKVVESSTLDIAVVESLSEEMFGHGDLPELNKIQVSGLIDELLSRYGKRQKRESAPAGRFNGRTIRIILLDPEHRGLEEDPVQRLLEKPVSASRLNLFHSCRLKFYFR